MKYATDLAELIRSIIWRATDEELGAPKETEKYREALCWARDTQNQELLEQFRLAAYSALRNPSFSYDELFISEWAYVVNKPEFMRLALDVLGPPSNPPTIPRGQGNDPLFG